MQSQQHVKELTKIHHIIEKRAETDCWHHLLLVVQPLTFKLLYAKSVSFEQGVGIVERSRSEQARKIHG
jgi:hypothetical protein